MAWLVLIVSGMLESVWAVALGASHGFKRLVPTVIFLISVVASMVGLAWSMKHIPTGTAYAVWVGIGATLTVLWGFLRGYERPTVVRVALLVLLVGSVVGLKVVS